MYKILKARMEQGRRTIGYPAEKPVIPDRLRGLPVISQTPCPDDCRLCADICPTVAIDLKPQYKDKPVQIDLGKCLYCGDCERVCPEKRIQFTNDYRLAVDHRHNLDFTGDPLQLAKALRREILRVFKRSLKLRQVSAGGCNGCEVDINVLSTTVFDLGRFGIQIVASPRHADALIITGPVTENMRLALLKTYEATPPPKLVIALGACAISGGPFRDHGEVHNGVETFLPVNLFIPGCPPHPLTILDGFLRLLGKLN